MNAFRNMSLRTRLNILILLTVIPAWILAYYTASQQKRLEAQAILKSTLSLAHTAANAESRQLEATRHLLMTMSSFFLVPGARIDAVRGFYTELLKQSQGYADLGVLTPGGHLWLSARCKICDVDFSHRSWFIETIKNGHFAGSNLKEERIDGKPALYYALPVVDSHRQIRAVVYAALELAWFDRSLTRLLSDLPPQATLIQINASGTALVYAANTHRSITTADVNLPLFDTIRTQKAGVEEAVGRDHVARILAFAALSSPIRGRHVYIALEIPRRVAFAPSRRILTRNLILLAIAAVLALLIAWWASDVFILRRVNAMALASRRLAAGDLQARVGPIRDRDELSQLASALDDMAAALETRQAGEDRTKAALERSREQFRNLVAHQQAVREEERTRIAREIHDDFGQSLTLLKMDLAWLAKRWPMERPEMTERIESMSRLIDKALETLHTVSAELRPVILDDFGLAAAIEWQAEEFAHRTGIPCRADCEETETGLAKDLATAVFRIFQETLTNILRHAGASAVGVRLETRGGELILEVTDDGRGIREEEIHDPRSFGLIGIRERLYPWNGRVDFIGHPSKGTRVRVTIPALPKGDPE